MVHNIKKQLLVLKNKNNLKTIRNDYFKTTLTSNCFSDKEEVPN